MRMRRLALLGRGERACAGPRGGRARAHLLPPRPHPRTRRHKWRRPWPPRGPSPTCSSTWTASFWVSSRRPRRARAARGREGAAMPGTPEGGARTGRGPVSPAARMRTGLWRRRRSGHPLPVTAPCKGVAARKGAPSRRNPPARCPRAAGRCARSTGLGFPVCTWGCTHLAGRILQSSRPPPPAGVRTSDHVRRHLQWPRWREGWGAVGRPRGGGQGCCCCCTSRHARGRPALPSPPDARGARLPGPSRASRPLSSPHPPAQNLQFLPQKPASWRSVRGDAFERLAALCTPRPRRHPAFASHGAFQAELKAENAHSA